MPDHTQSAPITRSPGGVGQSLPPNLRPRDAATLILIKWAGGVPRILMGRRSSRHAFMPGSYVFPGGRVDAGDARMACADDLDREHLEKLLVDMKGRPSEHRARALALAAVRETWEEAGIMLGALRQQSGPALKAPEGWSSFAAMGVLPRLSELRFLGRAITPPRRPRRFDTRFFAAFAESIAHIAPDASRLTSELEDVAWLTLAEARETNLPGVTLRMIDHLERRLETDPGLSGVARVPYYYMRHGKLQQSEI